MTLSDTAQAGGLRLEIRGVDPRSEILTQLFGTGQAQIPAVSQGRGMKRFLRSAGIGVAGSFLLCCALPIGLVGLLGAGATVYLGKLESLPVLAAATLIFGGLAWWWHPQPTLKETDGKGSGCGC